MVVGEGVMALNRINQNRALFGVRSPIKVPNTPRSEIGYELIKL